MLPWLEVYSDESVFVSFEVQIVKDHLEPLTEQQLVGIYNLQQSSQQAEDALTQGMEALQQSLSETLSSTSLGPVGAGNVADYMGQMAIAMGKLANLESFLHQVRDAISWELKLINLYYPFNS